MKTLPRLNCRSATTTFAGLSSTELICAADIGNTFSIDRFGGAAGAG